MNLEYWQAKAEVCRKVGIEQLMAGDIPNGTRNLKRMVRSMEEINLIKASEGEDKSAEDMWASLITNGLLLASVKSTSPANHKSGSSCLTHRPLLISKSLSLDKYVSIEGSAISYAPHTQNILD